MPPIPYTRNRIRLILLSLLSVATTLVVTGVIAVPAGTGSGTVLLLAVVLTDLLHEYSPDTPDPVDEPRAPDGPEPDLDTDLLIRDAWREDG